MNKSVLVTGATSGTGIAIAERFAKEGYDVFITSRDIEKAKKCAKDIADKYNCFAKGYELDAKSEQQVIDMFDDIKNNYNKKYGKQYEVDALKLIFDLLKDINKTLK